MEKETVLEIEFKDLGDSSFAWKITKQNEDILIRGKFKDEEIGVNSDERVFYCTSNDTLHIRGRNKHCDNDIHFCTEEGKITIEEKVKAVNEKYGIKKRWRAKYGYGYYYINDMFEVNSYAEIFSRIDNEKYETLNYFETEEEAKEYAEYMKKCSLEWHEKRENNE